MKIGITTFGSDSGVSGMSQYAINLFRAFAAMNDSHQYEVMVFNDKAHIFVPQARQFHALCFETKLRHPVVNLAWHQIALPGLCRKRNYDVLFITAGNRRIPYTAPCPMVGAVHDLATLHIKDKYDRIHMFYNHTILLSLIRRLARIVTFSECSKRDIVEYTGFAEERVSVIPHGVNHECYFPRDKRQAMENVNRSFNIRSPYVLYVARIEHPGKNHVHLIRAFELLKSRTGIPHSLVLVGSDRERAEEIHRLAAQSAFASDIRFTGFAPESMLPDLYAAADAMAFPSLYEGFGLPIVEAMACGTPVACSNVSSLPEVAGDAAVLFTPTDAEEMAASLERILLQDAFREQLIERGLARSRQFNWATSAKHTLEVFEMAASEGRQRS